MAACLWQAIPQKKSLELKSLIQESSNQFNEPDSLLGYGIPNFSLALTMVNSIQPRDVFKDELLPINPNPFQDEITIPFYTVENKITVISITDISGKYIFTNNFRTFKMAVNNLQISELNMLGSGIYFIAVKTENQIFNQKIIKF
jgi:hypothetical protein